VGYTLRVTTRVPYNGFIIEARVRELSNDLGWTWDFSIEKHDGQAVTVTPFFHQQLATQSTEESALAVAVAHAKKKIDDGFQLPLTGA